MPDLMEQMYCAQQINIPPNLPFILKQYAKAAIRTQPHDLLFWSAAYFRAKANNSPPPVKERLEYPPFASPSRLSPGFLKVLHKQLGENEVVASQVLYEKWLGVCLVKEALDSMLRLGNLNASGKVPWLKFVAIAAGNLCENLKKTMVLICEVLTEEPEGGSAMIPVQVFVELYQFLARLDCGPEPPPPSAPSTPAAESGVGTPQSSCPNISTKREATEQSGSESEQDSTAGLMVWVEQGPPEKPRPHSSRYEEEVGASSEFGVEVLDDATGERTEVITLYSAQPTDKSVMSMAAKTSEAGDLTITDKGVLSHSSLKENEDWIEIKRQDQTKMGEDDLKTTLSNWDEKQQKSEGTSESAVDGVEEIDEAQQSQDNQTSKTDLKPISIKRSKTVTIMEEENKQEEKSVAKISTAKPSSRKIVSIKSDQTAKAASSKDVTVKSFQTAEEASSKDVTIQSNQEDDSQVFEVGESATMEQFLREDLALSTATYSSVEIRRGFVGEKSRDLIERESSENTVRAADTAPNVNPLTDESSGGITPVASQPGWQEYKETRDDEESVEGLGTGVTFLDEQSQVLEPTGEEPWQHIPGIGPVIPEPQILAVVEYMQYWASKQEGVVMPRNVNHLLCPPLDLPPPPQETDTD